MTSPFHVFFISILFNFNQDVIYLNKLFGLGTILISSFIVAFSFKDNSIKLITFALTALAAPSILWAVGGLETSLLGLAITCSIPFTKNVLINNDKSSINFLLICCLAGLAFLIRYDSIIFFIILISCLIFSIYISRKLIALSLLIGGLAPLVWLGFCLYFYGDLLPTPFYIKTPSFSYLFKNFNYIVLNIFLIGTGFIFLISLLFLKLKVSAIKNDKKLFLIYILALGGFLLYGITMATVHMMFQFRAIAPYIPLLNFVLGLFLVSQPLKRSFYITSIFFILVLASINYWQTYNKSINGFASFAEYKNTSIPSYENFLEVLRLNALDIKEHQIKNLNPSSTPRLYTFAGGVIPFNLNNFYVYESLVSYRHKNTGERKKIQSSNYIHILFPRHGSIESQINNLDPTQLELISKREIIFDGYPEKFLVYWNKSPLENSLSNRVDR